VAFFMRRRHSTHMSADPAAFLCRSTAVRPRARLGGGGDQAISGGSEVTGYGPPTSVIVDNMNTTTAPPLDLVTTAEAARILGRSPQRIRQLANAGDLAVVARVGTKGNRLYARADVERLAHERALAAVGANH
jgi:hypothetical protein